MIYSLITFVSLIVFDGQADLDESSSISIGSHENKGIALKYEYKF